MTAVPEPSEPLGWWTISGAALLGALRAVGDGEDPDMVYAELYANSDHDQPADEAEHRCSDEPWTTLRVLAQFLNSGAALMKDRAHYEGAKWCVSKVQQLRDGEITVGDMRGSGGVL